MSPSGGWVCWGWPVVGGGVPFPETANVEEMDPSIPWSIKSNWWVLTIGFCGGFLFRPKELPILILLSLQFSSVGKEIYDPQQWLNVESRTASSSSFSESTIVLPFPSLYVC